MSQLFQIESFEIYSINVILIYKICSLYIFDCIDTKTVETFFISKFYARFHGVIYTPSPDEMLGTKNWFQNA